MPLMLPAVLDSLKERRDMLNITIAMLEEELQRARKAERAAGSARRRVTVTHGAEPTNGHTNGRVPVSAILDVLSTTTPHKPRAIVGLVNNPQLTPARLSVRLVDMKKRGLVRRTAKGWLLKK